MLYAVPLTASDLQIWKSFLQGDSVSLEQILRSHYQSLFHFGSKYTSEQELVKDCIQELFTGLWQRRSRLSETVSVKAYLFASLRRLLHRKLHVENRFLRFATGSDLSNRFDFELSVEEKLIAHETTRRRADLVVALVAALPKRQKEVVYLKFFQELTRDEIAAVMEISPQTISNLLQNALKKLREGMPGTEL